MKIKNKKIIYITVSILIILIALLIIVFIKTDLLKNDKQKFIWYSSQIYNKENGLIPQKLVEYINKRLETPYKDEGGIKVIIDSEKEKNKYTNINNSNIRFIGKVDNKNKKQKQDIKINYSDKVNFPIEYKKIDKQIGIKSKYIHKKSIVFNNKNEKEKIKLNEEEKNKLLKETIKVLNKELTKDKFSSIEDNKGIELKITNSKIREIENKILENTIQKLNEQDKYNIKKIKENLENEKIEEKNIKIKLFKEKNKLYKIRIEEEKERYIEIEKLNNQEELNYIIKFLENKEKKQTGKIDIKFNGISGLNSIYEKYDIELNCNEETKYNYQINNNITFIENAEIEEFTDKNSIILDKYPKEKANEILDAIKKIIERINKEQMKELRINEEKNPIQYLIPKEIRNQLKNKI